MIDSLRRNITLFTGLVVCGLISAQAAGFMTSSRGAPGPTILQAESSGVALIAVVVCLALSLVVAVAVARTNNTAVGAFVFGAGAFVLARRLTTVEEIARAGGSMPLVVVELAVWTVLLLAAVVVLFRFGGALRDVHPGPTGRTPNPLTSGAALRAAAAGILVLPVIWIIAQSPMKGQVLGAVFLGALLSGMVGRLISPHVQPVLLFVAACVFGIVGYLIGMAQLPGPMVDTLITGRLPALLLPMPVDYAAGSLMGVAVGLGCAKSFLHHHEEA